MFGDKEFGKHTGFPTPVDTPDETTCLMIQVPANAAWWAIYVGLIYSLLEEDSWQQFEGGMTREDAAADSVTTLEIRFAPPQTDACGIADVPAPYWDDAEDSDDQAPPDTQVWYGDIVSGSFVENVENWAIAGFIAAACQPAAALYFLTIAPRFRLAWKTADIGGIVRVFIDAEDYGTVDTAAGSEGILTMDIIPTTEADTHTVLLVKEGA